jgi:hypothetical protein
MNLRTWMYEGKGIQHWTLGNGLAATAAAAHRVQKYDMDTSQIPCF